MQVIRSFRLRLLAATFAVPMLLTSVAATSTDQSRLTPAEILRTKYNSLGPLALPGIRLENFGVVDGRIYRGGQPEKSDYAALKTIGVNTVIDLRADFERAAKASAEAAGLRYLNIPMVGQQKPTDAETAAFIRALDDLPNGVVYVHCAGGRHRTGSMIAIYRMVRDGWDVNKAYDEMLKFDFYTRFGHGGFKDYVFDYFKRMSADPASVPFAYAAATNK